MAEADTVYPVAYLIEIEYINSPSNKKKKKPFFKKPKKNVRLRSCIFFFVASELSLLFLLHIMLSLLGEKKTRRSYLYRFDFKLARHSSVV